MLNYGVILLGGDSLRTSTTIPKQYIIVNGKEIFLYSLETFIKNENIDKILLVVSSLYLDLVKIKIIPYKKNKSIKVIKGGSTRQESSFLALRYIKEKENNLENLNVIIHDSARPLLTTDLLDRIIAGVQEKKAVTSYIPLYNSLCTSKDQEKIEGYTSRDETFALQTPQAFSFDLIYKAHEEAINNHYLNINDDSILVKKLNKEVYLILGDALNFKITTFDDLKIFKRIVE